MTLTENEKRTVKAVFRELLNRPYNEINKYLGSSTIMEMYRLYNKLKHEQYCEDRGISYEDMTEDDFIQANESDREVNNLCGSH